MKINLNNEVELGMNNPLVGKTMTEIDALRARVKELERKVILGFAVHDEVEQTLGKALGYPWFKNDQANFPGADESSGVCIGEHCTETIADEAAAKITKQEARIRELEEAMPDLIQLRGSAARICLPTYAHDGIAEKLEDMADRIEKAKIKEMK